MRSYEHRLRRLEGQLARLRTDIGEHKECTDVIPQFLAVRGALESAFAQYVQEMMHECAHTNDTKKLERLITMLVRK